MGNFVSPHPPQQSASSAPPVAASAAPNTVTAAQGAQSQVRAALDEAMQVGWAGASAVMIVGIATLVYQSWPLETWKVVAAAAAMAFLASSAWYIYLRHIVTLLERRNWVQRAEAVAVDLRLRLEETEDRYDDSQRALRDALSRLDEVTHEREAWRIRYFNATSARRAAAPQPGASEPDEGDEGDEEAGPVVVTGAPSAPRVEPVAGAPAVDPLTERAARILLTRARDGLRYSRAEVAGPKPKPGDTARKPPLMTDGEWEAAMDALGAAALATKGRNKNAPWVIVEVADVEAALARARKYMPAPRIG